MNYKLPIELGWVIELSLTDAEPTPALTRRRAATASLDKCIQYYK